MNWIPNPKAPRDLTDALLKGIAKGSIVFLMFITAYTMAAAILPELDMEYDSPREGNHFTMTPLSPVEELIYENDCWTGEAPADMQGEFPGHVVVSVPGEGPRYAGKRMVGKALDQIFENVDHGPTVHGFCR